MLTDMEGNPPIYISRRRSASGEEIFVNNAMIIKSRSNVELKNDQGNKQVSWVKLAKKKDKNINSSPREQLWVNED